MALIFEKDMLEAINDLTNESIFILDSLVKDDQATDKLMVDKEFLSRLLGGYLYLYNKSIEHAVMPAPSKHKHFSTKLN